MSRSFDYLDFLIIYEEEEKNEYYFFRISLKNPAFWKVHIFNMKVNIWLNFPLTYAFILAIQ